MAVRTAVYARVSTEDQADLGYSLPSQVESCRRYAEINGLDVTVELLEDCSGAIYIRERTRGRQLVTMIAKREIDAVVVHALDRLGRSPADLTTSVRDWTEAGIQVHAGDIGRITGELDLLMLMKAWQSGEERARIRERTMRGKRSKARSGKVVGGRESYGYHHLRDSSGRVVTFEIDEDEAKIIQMIYRLYLEGDGDGKPLSGAGIARRLSEMRQPTPGEVRPSCTRTRAPGMWAAVTVLNILGNETYAGVWRYGVRIGTSSERYPESEQIQVDVPAIIDRETWEAAQERRARNRKTSRRNRRREYLLSGIILCGCGFSRVGAFRNNHRYYYCNERSNRHVALEGLRCRDRAVRADAIEADVWESLVDIFRDLTRLEDLLKQSQAKELETMEPKRLELETVEAMIAECEQHAAQIALAIVKVTGQVGHALEQQATLVNQRHEALTQRRDELLTALSAARVTDQAIRDIVKLASNVHVGLDNADSNMQRRILEELDLKVIVSEGRFYVKSVIGEWEGIIRRIPSARWNKDAIATSSC